MISNKQKEVVRCVELENPKILVLSGAKRAGKTVQQHARDVLADPNATPL